MKKHYNKTVFTKVLSKIYKIIHYLKLKYIVLYYFNDQVIEMIHSLSKKQIDDIKIFKIV